MFAVAPAGDPFTDDEGHPDELTITALGAAGIVRGTSEATVGADKPATRGQLATLSVRVAETVLGRPIGGVATIFVDIATSVHRGTIEKAYAAGLVRGFDPAHFRPDEPATYGHAAMIATRVLGLLVGAAVVDPPASAGSLELVPVPTIVRDTIAGQRVLLLLVLGRDDDPGSGPVTVTATAPGAAVSANTTALRAGVVAEITVVPEPGGGQSSSPQAWVPLRITGERGADRHRIVIPVRVLPGTDTLAADAGERFEAWVDWLAAAQPGLEITAATEWTRTITQPHTLVVSHHLFFSETWELGLMWHIMIPPYDWTEIYPASSRPARAHVGVPSRLPKRSRGRALCG